MNSVIGFFVCAAVIFFCGKKLSHYGDIIAELTGMGKAWLGLIVLAGVTSLPELVVGYSSAAIVGSADLAVGDILGSCAFNLGLLALLDAFVPQSKPILGQASLSHILAAALGIILLALVGAGMCLDRDIILIPGIGITSVGFMAIYFIAARIIYKYNLKTPHLTVTESLEEKHSISLKKAVTLFALYAVFTVAVALFLPHFAEEIALLTGIGHSFAGTCFLAVSTSLPEIAVSIAAIRRNSIDLSVGNLLGSNMFNIFILALDDIFYTKGPLLKDAADANLISVFAVIIMSAIAITGLIYKSEHKRFRMAWDAMVIFLIYIVSLVLLFYHTAGS
ncbi:MAG: hypothetical protein JNL72_04205 [Flavipsychrobacter sp.]|nr:hypothetical protein [Flavipsychrobacter sp.]